MSLQKARSWVNSRCLSRFKGRSVGGLAPSVEAEKVRKSCEALSHRDDVSPVNTGLELPFSL